MSQEIGTVSVVIPTHDRLALLDRAIESVKMQSMLPREVLVVDDVGNIEVRSLVESQAEFQEFPIRYIDASSLAIKAAGASRNVGAAAASGEILAFLDDDDYWDPAYLAGSTDVLELQNLGLVVTSAFNQVGGILEPGMTPSRQSFTGIHPGMTGSNMVVTREAFDSIGGFDPRMWVMNDTDFFIRLRSSGARMGVLSDRLVIQEGRGVGHLSSKSERRAKGLEYFLQKHSEDLAYIERRGVKRRIHRARTGPEHRAIARIFHTVALCFYTAPSGYYSTIKRRILFRRPMY